MRVLRTIAKTPEEPPIGQLKNVYTASALKPGSPMLGDLVEKIETGAVRGYRAGWFAGHGRWPEMRK